MFIVIEGIDGCGKTTQASRLVTHLERRGRRVLHVREPGTTRLGERLRDIVLSRKDIPISPRAEALLYSCARAELVESVLKPALKQREIVVCERYVYSTLAYQGAGLQLDEDLLDAVQRFAIAGLKPERVIVLDLDPGIARTRLSGKADRIEARGSDYFDRVRKAFLQLAARDPTRFVVIDASRAVDLVAADVARAVDDAVS